MRLLALVVTVAVALLLSASPSWSMLRGVRLVAAARPLVARLARSTSIAASTRFVCSASSTFTSAALTCPRQQRASLRAFASVSTTASARPTPSPLAAFVMAHSSGREAFEALLRPEPGHKPITPTSSPEDKREYRVITLANSLAAVLVSDPQTDKAAAALDVHVGHFSDPAELPGLAHFLEHMLFLGTEKYPDENSYAAFLSSHGGASNAYTSTENTNYYYDVSHPHLAEALDRFAQFFIGPLFTASCVERELNAVHNENAKNLLVDNWRSFQLLKSTSSPDHPFSKFGTGNHATLRDGPREAGIDVRAELIKFHKTKYSADIMRVCVIGRESLDQLETMVREKFEPIPRVAGNTRPVFGSQAMTSAELSRRIHVVPIKDSRALQLLWHFDAPTQHLFGEKPLELLSHCLGHESTGSIFAHLKARGLANGLSSGVKMATTSFTLFTVSVDLTESGLEKADEIAEIIFSYLIHVLRRSLVNTPEKWSDEIFAEVKTVGSNSFRFKSKESPQNLVSALAQSLQVYPPQHVLDGAYEFRSYDRELLQHMLDHLINPANLRVHLVGQKFKKELEAAGKILEKEKWYQTEYLNEPISAELLARITNPAVVPDLALPPFNTFLASEFGLKHTRHTEEQTKAKVDYAPVKLPESLTPGHPLSAVWFKPDRTFMLPKANLLLRFVTPLAYASPANTLLANLYAQLTSDALNEYAYNANVAGLSYSLYSTQQGLQLSVGGYDEKQATLLKAILDQMRSIDFASKAEDFARLREQLKRGLINFVKENPYSHAMFDEVHALEEHLWPHGEKLAVIDALTVEQLGDFSKQLLANAEIDLFVHGNVNEAEVHAIAAQVQDTLAFRPLFASQMPLNRVVQLAPGTSCLRQVRGLNPADANSCALNLYQLGENTVELHATAELFSHLIKEPLYNQLRTTEQLGYLVWSNLVLVKGVLHFRVLLQSSNCPGDYLNYRVEAFIQWYRNVELPRQLAADPEFFTTNVAAVIAKKEEKDKTLSAESTRLWNEITTKRLHFDRVEREVAVLKSLDKNSLLKFIDTFIAMAPAEGESRRAKFSVQYFGSKAVIPEVATFETAERVSFANSPLKAAAATPTAAEDGAVAAPPAGEEVVDDAATPLADAVVLPQVPVDHRPVRMLDDLVAFKRTMPLWPSMQ